MGKKHIDLHVRKPFGYRFGRLGNRAGLRQDERWKKLDIGSPWEFGLLLQLALMEYDCGKISGRFTSSHLVG